MKTDPRVDAYIAAAAPFARPILRHLRRLVHRADPAAEETIKWGFPFFLHEGQILCLCASFKAHCTFRFWHQEMKAVVAPAPEVANSQFGRITCVADLPAEAVLIRYLKTAAALCASGRPAQSRAVRKARPRRAVPADLRAALRQDAAAASAYAGLAPSHQRAYVEWITEAKRPETRAKRLASTLTRLAAGQPLWSEYRRS